MLENQFYFVVIIFLMLRASINYFSFKLQISNNLIFKKGEIFKILRQSDNTCKTLKTASLMFTKNATR